MPRGLSRGLSVVEAVAVVGAGEGGVTLYARKGAVGSRSSSCLGQKRHARKRA